jgi:hypothetical protein
MSDFRDRFEVQLVDAARREGLGVRDRRLVHLPVTIARRRMLVVALIVLAVGVAGAATRPWSPTLGSDHFDELRPSASSTGPPSRQLQILGVLRREQTPTDRSAASDAALRYLTGRTSQGVRIAYVRSVAEGQAVLIPVASVTRHAIRLTDALCVFFGDPTGDGGVRSCWTTDDVVAGRARNSLGRLVYGMVPDGISRVRLTFVGAQVVEAPVQDNFFVLSAPPAPTHRPDAAAAATIRQVVWLDGAGFPAGPPLRGQTGG